MIKIRVIHYQTGESQEKTLSSETMIQGGGLIGRNPQCDLVLNSPEVSRVHGRIFYKEGDYYFTDLGSTDGSQVNSEDAKTNQNFLLTTNDIIRIGDFILLIDQVFNDISPVSEFKNDSVVQAPTQLEQRQDDCITDPLQIQELIFKAEELKAQGILKQGIPELVFQDKRLVEDLSLSKRFHQKALELCQSELNIGKFCILVEYCDHFTIWQQKIENVT
ncbi:MAG: FHA domain-containing protein [Coleofasciculaceae cyanobacterium]